MDSKTIQFPRVLYIEDNDQARSLVARLMAGRYLMFDARDPITGIELAEKVRPDLVLLDLNLPDMSGVEVLTRLFGILKPGTPVVALSADSDADIRERVSAAGFSGFLSKPIEIDAFYKLLDSLLCGSNASRQPGSPRVGYSSL